MASMPWFHHEIAELVLYKPEQHLCIYSCMCFKIWLFDVQQILIVVKKDALSYLTSWCTKACLFSETGIFHSCYKCFGFTSAPNHECHHFEEFFVTGFHQNDNISVSVCNRRSRDLSNVYIKACAYFTAAIEIYTKKLHYNLGPLFLTWFNLNPSMDK